VTIARLAIGHAAGTEPESGVVMIACGGPVLGLSGGEGLARLEGLEPPAGC
jgi:hypothetical protein